MPYIDKDFKPTVFEYTNVNDYNRLLVYYPRKGGRREEAPPDVTPSVTPTITPTPSITPTITPSPSFVLECHIEAQNGDFIIAQNGDYIDHFPCPDPSPTPTPSATVTPTASITPSITPTITPTPSTSVIPFDADAAAYLADVITSGGTVDATMSAATDTLFTSLKSAGLYSYMEAMYPFVGATAASHSINALGNKTYDITWNGGLTHNVSGTTGNGTNGYGDTNVSSSLFPQDDYTAGFYQFTSLVDSGFNLGANETGELPAVQIASNWNNDYWFRLGDNNAASNPDNFGVVNGNYIGTRTSSTQAKYYRNTTEIAQLTYTTATHTSGNKPMFVWTISYSGGIPFTNYSAEGMNFIFFMSKGLTSTEVSTLDGIINDFQTTLGRNTY